LWSVTLGWLTTQPLQLNLGQKPISAVNQGCISPLSKLAPALGWWFTRVNANFTRRVSSGTLAEAL